MTHRHVTERTNGAWVLCAEASAVMWQWVTGASVPTTTAEACALRRAEGSNRSCESGGSSAAQLRVGMAKRWSRNAPASIGGWPALEAALRPGTAGIVMGQMAALGPHWRRWDPSFGGRHAVEVERRDDTASVWWDDPLAPVGLYQGEPMPIADLERFVRGWTGARHIVAPITGWSGGPNEPMIVIEISDPTSGAVAMPAGTKILNLDGTERGAIDAPATVPSPFGTPRGRAIEWGSGGIVQLLLAGGGHFAPTVNELQARRDEYDAILAGIGIPPRP